MNVSKSSWVLSAKTARGIEIPRAVQFLGMPVKRMIVGRDIGVALNLTSTILKERYIRD